MPAERSRSRAIVAAVRVTADAPCANKPVWWALPGSTRAAPSGRRLARGDLMTRREALRAATAAAGLAAFGLPASARARILNGFDVSDALVPVQGIEAGGPPRDGIPAIDHPRFLAASQAGIAPTDRVLGLALGAEARAYPVRILTWHEVVNDRIGDRSVAITYCPLCGTGMAFDARIDGQVTRFGVSGLLYNSDVLLYDRRTESLWSQIMAKAVAGPLKGQALDALPLTHTSWAAWRARHPRTRVLSSETGYVREYARDPYEGYDAVPRLLFDVQHRDDRLPVKAWVMGLVVGGHARAYPFDWLARKVDRQGRWEDRLGGQRILIRYDRAARSAEAFDASGRPLASVSAFWFAWVAFHPNTELVEGA